MKTSRLPFTALLLALSALAGVRAASACKYCYSAENAAAADYARQAMSAPAAPDTTSGAFPLDATINQFQPAPAAATLSAAPAPDKVVTNATDLRAAKAAALGTAPTTVASAAPTTVVKGKGSAHYADAGLLGLAAVGGVFCWRTRRKTGPGR